MRRKIRWCVVSAFALGSTTAGAQLNPGQLIKKPTSAVRLTQTVRAVPPTLATPLLKQSAGIVRSGVAPLGWPTLSSRGA